MKLMASDSYPATTPISFSGPCAWSRKSARLTPLRALEVIAAPPPETVIEGLAWGGSVSVIVSESGVGKTFLLLDAAAAVSGGTTWHGRNVQHASVVYLSFEGDALGSRLQALRDHGRHLDNLHIIRGSHPLSPRIDRDGEAYSLGESAVIDAIGTLASELDAEGRPPVRLLIVDTVRASMVGSEDSSDHVSAYLRAVRRIASCVPGAGVILAHHSGWQDGEFQRRRERGSSAWRGNCDATFYLEAGEYEAASGSARLILRTLKVRDGYRPPPLHLIRSPVTLLDTAGQPSSSSCVIERDPRTRADREADARAAVEAAACALDLRVLRMIADHPDIATSRDRIRMCVGGRREVVELAIARVTNAKWVRPPKKQRQPYRLTPEGRRQLATESSPSSVSASASDARESSASCGHDPDPKRKRSVPGSPGANRKRRARVSVVPESSPGSGTAESSESSPAFIGRDYSRKPSEPREMHPATTRRLRAGRERCGRRRRAENGATAVIAKPTGGDR